MDSTLLILGGVAIAVTLAVQVTCVVVVVRAMRRLNEVEAVVRSADDTSKGHLRLFHWFLRENGWSENFAKTQVIPDVIGRKG